MKIKPACRYGHGDLAKNDSTWSLQGVEVVAMTVESNVMQPLSVMQNGRGFSVSIYRCPTCGYIELFDDVIDNE